MFKLAERLWPLPRSISGEGTRTSLRMLQSEFQRLQLCSFSSGSQAFDWTVPDEWEARSAYIVAPDGEIFCDFSQNNLHLVGYSEPIDTVLSLDELQPHLYSLSDNPDAIPYVTSYYERNWGFCLSQRQRDGLKDGDYRVLIDTSFSRGVLDYGEIYLPGTVRQEIFLSTYVCHPSMANNELSGPVLSIELAKYLSGRPRYYSYRFVFLPETIGAVAYIHANRIAMQEAIIAGYVLTCMGDDRCFSYLPSRLGNTLADRLGLEALKELAIEPVVYSWKDRGSDERQYCAPQVDLPVCSIMRSKYGTYPEYHTSFDRLGSVVTERGLQESYDFFTFLLNLIESKRLPRAVFPCEPQLGKRGLKANISGFGQSYSNPGLMEVLSHCDGKHTVEEIADLSSVDFEMTSRLLAILTAEGLVEGA